MTQLSITKPIRLIELFAGIGSQAMALRNIGADFEKYIICEWQTSAIASYKAIHFEDDNTDYSQEKTKEELADILFNLGISSDGKNALTRQQIARKPEQWLRTTYNNIKATNNLVNITKITGADLKISETDKYTYILTYSFPCQDLSIAGKMAGMDKGAGTRSGLLWEVERLLNEMRTLPQILLMENVPAVIGAKNEHNFKAWCDFLQSKGYKNHVQLMNAKDYGAAQNRKRAFMVSIQGGYAFEFPEPIPLNKTINDYLEDEVDAKYYIPKEKTKDLIKECEKSDIAKKQISNTIRRGGRRSLDRHSWDVIVEDEPDQTNRKLL